MHRGSRKLIQQRADLRLRLAEAQRLEEDPLGPRLALGRGDTQAADDRLLHRHGDRAVSVTDGDQARGFVEHDLRQRIKRRGKFFGTWCPLGGRSDCRTGLA